MWLGVEPSELCRQHLLGEHSELHQEVGTWLRHPHGEAVVRGHVEAGQVDPAEIRRRHDRLAEELERRGLNHDSPLEAHDAGAMPSADEGAIDGARAGNRGRLASRCADCRARMREED